jgi:hypothetical protein
MIGLTVLVEGETMEDTIKGLRKAISVVSQGFEQGFEQGKTFSVSWVVEPLDPQQDCHDEEAQ